MNKIIYLDNAATTKPNEKALGSAVEYYQQNYYNPSSLYRGGRKVSLDLDECRKILLSGNRFHKIMFTSCGTESDNTAIFGFGKRGNIVTTMGEHSAVYNAFMKQKEKGLEVRFAKLLEGGKVDVDDLLSKIDKNTSFVSVVHVNNETGAINPINEIAEKVKKIAPNCVFHSDGVQAFGKINTRLSQNIDLYSVSAHKIGGLKGAGALLYKQGLHVQPYVLGGGQEGGLRSGTENVLGIKLFAEAFKERYDNLNENYQKARTLKQAALNGLDKNLFKILSPEESSPYVLCVSAAGLRGAVLQNMLDDDGIIVGTGSACSSKKPFSRIISSFNNDQGILNGVVRLSFSTDTELEDVKYAVERLNYNARKLSEKII